MMSGRKEGDKAFRAKKWGEAIAHYNEVKFTFNSYTNYLPFPLAIVNPSSPLSPFPTFPPLYFFLFSPFPLPPSISPPFVSPHSPTFFLLSYNDFQYQKLGIELPCLFFARRSFSYLMNGDPDSSLRSALQSRAVDPEWYMAYFLVAAALKGHNQMEHVAQEIAKGIEKYQAMSTTDFSET